jgi:hypothetical protein
VRELQLQLSIITEIAVEASFAVAKIFYGYLASKIIQYLASAVIS